MMELSQQQVNLVQHSFERIVDNFSSFAEAFYTRLFELRPDFAPLFREDLRTQSRKLLRVLLTVVNNADQLSAVTGDIHKLGQRHSGYQIHPSYFEPFSQALF
jgi:hemoglobin-like flavoprotein